MRSRSPGQGSSQNPAGTPTIPSPRRRQAPNNGELQSFEVKSFEVPRLGDREQDGMVRSLAEALDDPKPHAGVRGRVAANLFEHRVGHVVRAREREEAPAVFQDPKRTQVDPLVATRGRVERRAAAGEWRRIQDDQTEAGAVALEAPQLVEDVARTDLGPRRDTVELEILAGAGDRLGRGLDADRPPGAAA